MTPELAQVIVMCTVALTTGAVLILRPIALRLGSFLDAKTAATLKGTSEAELTRIREVLSSIDGRLDQIEERQDFAEALLSAADAKLLSAPAPIRAQERN